jgi:magnesium-transporting ATPase (P-type)
VEFPFDSTRKRMSLIIKHAGKYFLMTKGADSIMLPRLSMKDTKQMEADLMNFALQGLRTLVFSKRELSENDFKNFMKQY